MVDEIINRQVLPPSKAPTFTQQLREMLTVISEPYPHLGIHFNWIYGRQPIGEHHIGARDTLMRMVATMRHSRDFIAPVPRHPLDTTNAPSILAAEVWQSPEASEQLPLSPWVVPIRMAAAKPNYFSSYESLTRMASWIGPKDNPTPTDFESQHMYGTTNCDDDSAPCGFPLPESTPGDSREENISSSLPVAPAIPPHSISSQPDPSSWPSPTSPAASLSPEDVEANPHLRACPFLPPGTRFDVSNLKIHLVSWLDPIIAVPLEDIISVGCNLFQTRKADIQCRKGEGR